MTTIPVVILAAGKGTRLQPLTNTVPKPLLQIAGKSTLEHNLDSLLPYVSEIILVVGYMADTFKSKLGDSYNGVKITYIEQTEQKGTGHAAFLAKDAIQSDECFIMYTDDLYSKDHFEKLSQQRNSIIAAEKEDWQSYGVFEVDEQSNLKRLVEKPESFISNLVNIGMYRLDKAVLDEYNNIQESKRGEMEITDMVTSFSAKTPVKVIPSTDRWLPIQYPWHLLDAAEQILLGMDSQIDGVVEEGAVIKGKLILGKNSVIKAGAYIDGHVYIGENCVIGPNCYIRKFASIANDCIIGHGVEIKSSILGNSTKVPHLSYVPDSVLGNNVNYGGGTITANLRHDNLNVKAMVNGELIDAGRRKFGTVIGDNAKLGIHTIIYPGRKINTDKTTLPGQVVKEDIV